MLEERRMMMNGNGNSYHHHHYHHHHHYNPNLSESLLDGFVSNGFATIEAVSSSPTSNSNCSPSCSGVNYIQHRVSKLDTVAGVAIKYGVEVADIRRMNGLVTDLQMFARETLRIPLPGRHPPSPIVSDDSASNGEQTPPRRSQEEMFDSLQSLKLKPPRRVSPAMNSLQGFYGLAPQKRCLLSEGTEMSVYKTGRTPYSEDNLHTKEAPASDPGFRYQRKSKSLVSLENATDPEAGDTDESDKSVRRRQKADNDNSFRTREVLTKDDSGGGFFGRIGRGLALRPKVGSRMDVDSSRQSSTPISDFLTDVFVSVRKSSSTSNLQESETASFLWPTSSWSDAIARPIFDGLPKPMTVRKNKTALD